MHTKKGLVTTAIIHNLSLAVAYGGPIFATMALRPALLQGSSSDKDRGKVMQIAWAEFTKINVPAHLAFTATWLVERAAIKRYYGTRRTNKLVAVKDALIAGALLTGVANVVAGRMLKRQFPDGVPYPAEGNVTPEQAEKIARYVNFFRVVGGLNRALVGASIAAGPVIGASILRHQKRSVLSRLFKR